MRHGGENEGGSESCALVIDQRGWENESTQVTGRVVKGELIPQLIAYILEKNALVSLFVPPTVSSQPGGGVV